MPAPSSARGSSALYFYEDTRTDPSIPDIGNAGFYFYEDATVAPPSSITGSKAFYFYENTGLAQEQPLETAFYFYDHVVIPISSRTSAVIADTIEAASLQGLAIRITKLASDGSLTGSFVTTSSFSQLRFTPQYSDSQEIVVRSGQGVPIGTIEIPGTLESVALTLDLCGVDSDLAEMLSGGLTGADPVDYTAVGTDDDASGVVAIELWTRAVGEIITPIGDYPYYRWVFPYVELQYSGDRIIEENVVANEFSGDGWSNSLFASGPMSDWSYTADRPYQFARETELPTVTA